MKSLTGIVEVEEAPPSLTPGVPLSPEVESPSLIRLLEAMKKEDGKYLLTEEEAEILSKLKFRESKEHILSLEHRYFLYEIIWLINMVGYEKTLNFLSVDWEKIFGTHNIRNKILRENPLLRPAKDKMILDMEIYRSRVDVSIGAVDCKKCKSSRTISASSQTRSGDEAMTIRVFCLECDFSWFAQ